MSLEKYTTHKQILIDQKNSSALPCQVSRTGATLNDDGDYVVKAGTPLYGDDWKTNRDVALTVSGVTAQGVLYQDVVFEKGKDTANGTLVYVGTVDLLKLESDVVSLITSAVKSALPTVHFVNGRKD